MSKAPQLSDGARAPLAGSGPAPGGRTVLARTFWTEERSLSSLLALLIVYHLVIPVAEEAGWGRLLGTLCMSLLAVSAALTSFRQWYLRAGVRAAAVVSLVVPWIALATPSRAAVVANTVADAALVSFLAAAVAGQVFKAGPVSAHRVRGAVVIYLLTGSLFGYLFQLVILADPGAFRIASEVSGADVHAIRRELAYFSFVTLTTVGYGDISPVSPVARALATLEAMTGQLFIAIVIASLVSNQASGAPEDGSRPEGS